MTRSTTDSEVTSSEKDYSPVWGERRGQDLRELARQIIGDKEDRMVKVLEYQRNRTGVISPGVVFDSADHAASWQWLLKNDIIFLQTALKAVRNRGHIEVKEKIESLIVRFQAYIEAAGIVLNEWYGALGYQGVDEREQVRGLIYMNSTLCKPHQDLLNAQRELRYTLLGKYPELSSHNRD